MATRRNPRTTDSAGTCVVRAAEAGVRTGFAHDAGAMLAIVLDRFPAAHAGELTENVDLAAFAGGAAPFVHRDVEVLETGTGLP